MTDWALRITGGSAPLELTAAEVRGVVALRAEAVLPAGLAGATLRLTLRGLSDAVTARLAGPGPLVAELYLSGARPGAPLPPFDPGNRVATVAVQRVAHHRGPYGPESTLDGVDAAYHRLAAPCRTPVPGGDHRAAAAELGRRAGVDVRAHGGALAVGPLPAGPSHLEQLAVLERALAEAGGAGAGPLALFRDGVLHLGARPAAQVTTHEVTPAWTERLGSAPGGRTAVRFGIAGDARLRPGDLVRLPGGPVREPLHVTSVRHALDPEHGFTTVAAAVSGATGQGADRAARPVTDPGADPAAAAARAVAGLGRAAAARTALPEAAEVRADDAGSGTATVWRGLAPGDGAAAGTRRLDTARTDPDRLPGVGRATPFAWGAYGLVVPRYPGTRVLLVPRQGRADDPVDVGALWREGEGPAARAGDWWLHLPAGVPVAQRAGVGDDRPGADPGDRASNDLTDADGNRVIEVGELTVRVGAAALHGTGTRPQRGDKEHAVTIEHADGGASLVIAADGSITLSGRHLRLEAQEDIEMKAQNVKVAVTGHMDVTG